MNQLASRIAGGAIVAAVIAGPVGNGAVDPPAPARAPSTSTATESLQEQPLDTEVDAGPPEPPKPRVVPPKRREEPPPRKEHRFRRVRTPRDEDLPAWVPISGRLTVVESCDLAENLGLAPMGTALDGGCPSVAALLEQERLERSRSVSER